MSLVAVDESQSLVDCVNYFIFLCLWFAAFFFFVELLYSS